MHCDIVLQLGRGRVVGGVRRVRTSAQHDSEPRRSDVPTTAVIVIVVASNALGSIIVFESTRRAAIITRDLALRACPGRNHGNDGRRYKIVQYYLRVALYMVRKRMPH